MSEEPWRKLDPRLTSTTDDILIGSMSQSPKILDEAASLAATTLGAIIRHLRTVAVCDVVLAVDGDPYISTQELGSLLSIQRLLTKEGKTLALAVPEGGTLREVLSVTRIDPLFHISPSVDEAIQHIRAQRGQHPRSATDADRPSRWPGDSVPPTEPALVLTEAMVQRHERRPDAPKDEDVLADWKWAFDALQSGDFENYRGQHVAIIAGRVVGSGADPRELRNHIAMFTGVDPARVVVLWVESE